MLTFLTTFAVMSAVVLPILASDPVRVHTLPPYIEPRAILQTRDVQAPATLVLSQTPSTNYPVETIGILGEPLVLSQSPSPTPTLAAAAKVGEPLQQSATGTTITQAGKVGTSVSNESNTFSTEINLPTNIPSTTTTSGIVATPTSSSSSFFTKHSIIPAIPNWAVLVIIISSSLIFFSLVGLVIWRVRKSRIAKRMEKDIDEEDIIEAYTKYWKTKRDSGGIVGKAYISSPLDEKMGRRSYI